MISLFEKELFNIPSAKIEKDVSMRMHTTFKIGGKCDYLIFPENIEQIKSVKKICQKHEVPFNVLGAGSNVLVYDSGVRGVVLKISSLMSGISIDKEHRIVTAQSGVTLSKLANAAKENSLEGFEFASGIPGTFGGGVCMNAGAYGREMKDCVVKSVYLDGAGEIMVLSKEDHDFSYRKSFFSGTDYIIVESSIELVDGKKEDIEAMMLELNLKRKQNQPLDMPSAGSVFKRPQGHFAGALIEKCGLKGYKIGGAQVSLKHAGFIVNAGGAKSDDVMRLIDHIKSEVYKNFGVELECEIKLMS